MFEIGDVFWRVLRNTTNILFIFVNKQVYLIRNPKFIVQKSLNDIALVISVFSKYARFSQIYYKNKDLK